ncbi:MAG: undecaprenyldiphospho-muramoylpentapeptide beta-N-acetylglucosaminyltransferase [Saprospiraceae bacterium]|nr:undecaprenyldiphospho-muramoylpentapeptide beta-N-acetylglucosaminyltransferase [Saprospiraceae bacterium]
MAKIIISGGGTGGHVFPAIAIADAIKKMRPDTEILFVGAKGKIEMEKVPKAGYPIEGLWISGFHRKLTLKNLLFPLKLLTSLWKARRIVARFKPDAAVGVGGYASGPLLRAATSRGIPALLQEQNSFAGVTNRILAAKAEKICVAYDHMERYFPAGKIVLTGNPVRSDLANLQATAAEGLKYFDLAAGKKTIFVFGGSLGARSINEAMAANAALLQRQPEIQVLWQVGSLYYETYKDCETARLPNVRLRPFIDRMDLAYAMADLVICRAGALTISELCLVGKASLLIPSPNVAEDHQTKNAQALVEKEAALLLRDRDAKELIVAQALQLLNNEPQLEKLKQNIRRLARPDAADRIAEEVLKLI